MTIEKELTFISKKYIQDYKNAIFKALIERLGYTQGCELYDSINNQFENINFDNPEYEQFYADLRTVIAKHGNVNHEICLVGYELES